MIKTNVDRTIELLEQSGEGDIASIAKTLGTTKDSIELILTFLEEEGMVELKYGVTKTIATLKKVKLDKKIEEMKEEEDDYEKEEEEARKKAEKEGKKKPELPKAPEPKLLPKHKIPLPKPEIKPKKLLQKPKHILKKEKSKIAPKIIHKPLKVMVPAFKSKVSIPKFDNKNIAKQDKMAAKITNMIINLVERFYLMPTQRRDNAVIVMNDIMKLAKENDMYHRKDPLSMEFILCSLLISIGTLIEDYETSKDFVMAKKIHSTYHLMRQIALKLEKPRLTHYESLIKDVYDRVIQDVYTKTMPQLKK